MSTENNNAIKSFQVTIDISTLALETHIEFLENAVRKSKANMKTYINHDLPDMSRSCERTTNGFLIALENAKKQLAIAKRLEKIMLQEKFFNFKPDSFTSKTKSMDPKEPQAEGTTSTAENPAAENATGENGQTTTSGNDAGPDVPAGEKPSE